ncbi:hypothetical protein HKK70_09145 [Bacillus safensis]|uniref:hypothetical protein n=1 Tax=Bacillus safensis TaxID=561879 RepID=UPI00146F3847|nr:hypothetical protein [Bacillus safensis]MCM3365941.1 hypothetical protein [Bacillus safensis]NMW01931.1 hypothetical protein [Bacillus safensis]
MRELIKKELSKPNMHNMFKGWADQEQILDELEEGYNGFDGSVEEYLYNQLNH